MVDKHNVQLILEGCLQGNTRSERRLFDLYYGHVMSITNRYSRDSSEAEEMLNDAFYTVFRKLALYDKQYPFRPWLSKVTVNCCLNYLRKYKKMSWAVELEEWHLQTIAEPLEIEIDVSEYLKLVQKLSPSYRAVFNLYVFEEYKHNEIASLLDITVGASKSNLSRAKANLKKMLSELDSSLKITKDIADG